MSDKDGKKPLGLGGGAGRPGQVKQSFSHGRTHNVVVETKRKRVVVPKPGAAAGGRAAAWRGGGPGQGVAMNRPTAKGAAVKPTVLIGFADALAAIESAYSLADHGFDVCAFARAGTRPAPTRPAAPPPPRGCDPWSRRAHRRAGR